MCEVCGCTPCKKCGKPIEEGNCSGCGKKAAECTCKKQGCYLISFTRCASA